MIAEVAWMFIVWTEGDLYALRGNSDVYMYNIRRPHDSLVCKFHLLGISIKQIHYARWRCECVDLSFLLPVKVYL